MKIGDYEIEHFERIYHNKSGDHIEVRPDRDGLGLIEIVADKDHYVMMPPDQALLVADSICRLAQSMIDAAKREI